MDSDTQQAQVAALANSLDHFTEDEFVALAGVDKDTVAAWRHRGAGPAYARLGKRILYPRKGVAAYLATIVRVPKPTPAKAQL